MATLLQQIQELGRGGRLRVSTHGFEAMTDDDISLSELLETLAGAVVVEEYPEYLNGAMRAGAAGLGGRKRRARALGTCVRCSRHCDADHCLPARPTAMVVRFPKKEAKMNKKSVRFVHANHYAAEVDVELIPDDGAWGPYFSLDDATKLDRVRSALKRGDIKAASREARVYRLMPLAG